MKIADFKEQLKQGKKIRRSGWGLNRYIYLDGEKISTSSVNIFELVDGRLNIDDIDADDWKLYIEKEQRQLDMIHLIMDEYRTDPDTSVDDYDDQLRNALHMK